MNAVTITEDVNSYASISQEDTTAPACKATPCRVMTHLVKVYSIKNVKMGKRVGMRTRNILEKWQWIKPGGEGRG